MITGELKTKINKIWNTFWNGGISSTLTIVEQLTYLIFIKNLDEVETRNERKAKRISSFNFKPVFGPEQQQFRWKNLKEMDPTQRHAIFADPLNGIFPFIRSLGKEKSLFSQYMRGANYGITRPLILDSVMDQLDGIDMTEQDTKGDVYEYLLSNLEGGGTSGQFRTPRHIIKMMVEMLQPTLRDIVCDPACGTAGFLVAVKHYIDTHYDDTDLSAPHNLEHINSKMFNGMEFDATMLRISAMNLFLHGVEEPNIIDVDAVSSDNTITNAYTIVLANPPFKGTIDKSTISTSLKNITNTSKTELLFLALMLRQLKAGGRCAVIVPDGVLFGNSKDHKSIREEIVKNNKLEAVISMPGGVFRPYAGVSTAILLFTKTDSGGTDKVWFYDMLADGKSLDDKRTPLVDDELFNDLSRFYGLDKEQQETLHPKFNIPDIIRRFGSREAEHRRKRTEQSFMVPFEEIEANDWDLSINRYKEIEYEEVKYDKPEEILSSIKSLDSERSQMLNELESLIK
jgi:type I restriction enzyme M protein